MAAEWEYRATYVIEDIDKVNESLGQWAEAGWELVSATTAAYDERVGNALVIRVQYTMFWRRPVRT